MNSSTLETNTFEANPTTLALSQPPTTTTISDPDHEPALQQVMGLIQQFINLLRSTFAVVGTTSKRATGPSSSLLSQQQQAPMRLFTKISHESSLVTDLQQSVLRVQQQQQQETRNVLRNYSYDPEDERLCILYQIILPLMDLLYHYCNMLDDQEDVATAARATPKSSTSSSPPPPSFLLSLQQYTDVAALVEVWMCYSVMIHVESSSSHMLLSIADRCRMALPKSLQGRLPRPSLLWAYEYHIIYQRQNAREHDNNDDNDPRPYPAATAAARELRLGIVTTTRLLLLDRFRPMLLPRHVTDLYAAIVQADFLKDATTRLLKEFDDDDEQDALYLQACHQLGLGKNLTTPTSTTTSSTSAALILIHPLLQARTCQTLLRQGAKTPPWVRQRVTPILTHLACHDMAALIQVFVAEASAPAANSSSNSRDGAVESDDILVGASLRLGHAILLAMQSQPPQELPQQQQTPRKNNNTLDKERAKLICQQLLRCLSSVDQHVWDTAAVPCTDGQPASNEPQSLSRHAVALIRTVQAVLEQMPDAMLCLFILPTFRNELLKYNSNNHQDSSQRCLRQLGALLALPRHDFGRLVRLFFLPLSTTRASNNSAPTLLVQLLRMASQWDKVQVMELEEDSSTRVRDDAKMVLQLLVQAMKQSSFSHQADKVDGMNVMCLALIHAVAWNPDHVRPSSHGGIHLLLSTDDYDGMIRDLEQRAQWVVDNLLTLQQETGSASGSKSAELPPSRFFQWLLWLYFWSTPSGSVPSDHDNHQIQLAVMMMLPLLCEKIPPEYLLLQPVNGKEEQEDAILPLIKLILASSVAQKDGIMDSQAPSSSEDQLVPDPTFTAAQGVLEGLRYARNLSMVTSKVNTDALPSPNKQPETLLSICYIVLSLLVAMLELGVQRRPRKQEEMLKSFLPLLERLATIDCLSSQLATPHKVAAENQEGLDDGDEGGGGSNAEIAEMAGHAMVLIASREAFSSSTDDGAVARNQPGSETSWESILNQSQVDLASDQPPIRARGVVSLRHFVRGDYFAKQSEELKHQAGLRIVEVTADDKSHMADVMISRVVYLCLTALSDAESFVYLAAIQTIVATADVNPQLVVPQLARALCAGSVALVDSEPTPANTSNDGTYVLTAEQRIKVAEALLFTIRRRASIYEYIPPLMAYMLRGTDKGTDKNNATAPIIDLQAATHEYFIHGNAKDDEEIEPTTQERMEARSIRVATGGPLFDTEENDLLRASCIQVLAELVMVAQPAVMAKYCPILVDLATNALALDISRPVRRAAALLSRELYAAASREFDDMATGSGQTLTMTIDLVSSREDKLLLALQRSVTIGDVAIGSQLQTFGFDPATVARCQEALAFREECENAGILAAAKILLAARRQDDTDAVATVVKRRLQEGTESHAVRLSMGGEINRDTLSLNL